MTVPATKQKDFESSCPWWQSDSPGIYGLRKYIKTENLTNEEIDLSFWPLKDEDIATLTASKPSNVKVLNLRGCTCLTDRGIFDLAQNWKSRGNLYHNLIELNLSNCMNLSDKSCETIRRYFSHMKRLDLSDCVKITDFGIVTLMKGCKYLERLHLRNLPHIHDESLLAIRQNLILIKTIRHIG